MMSGFFLIRHLNTTRPQELTPTDLAGLLESTPSDHLLRLAFADMLEESGELILANGQRWQAINNKYPYPSHSYAWHVIDFPSFPDPDNCNWGATHLRLPYQLIDWMGRNTKTKKADFSNGQNIYIIVWYSSLLEAEQALAQTLNAFGMTP